MAVLQMKKPLQALCYHHHTRMILRRLELSSAGHKGRIFAYACTEQGCPICFSASRGYFKMNGRARNGAEAAPWILCPNDGLPMHLTQAGSEETEFRVWRCGECNVNWMNDPEPVQLLELGGI